MKESCNLQNCIVTPISRHSDRNEDIVQFTERSIVTPVSPHSDGNEDIVQFTERPIVTPISRHHDRELTSPKSSRHIVNCRKLCRHPGRPRRLGDDAIKAVMISRKQTNNTLSSPREVVTVTEAVYVPPKLSLHCVDNGKLRPFHMCDRQSEEDNPTRASIILIRY